MRSKSEIRARLKQASFRYLKAFLEKHLDEVPRNCLHNDIVVIDPNKSLSLGMCTLSEETGHHVCDPRVPGCPSKDCKLFVHKRAKKALKEDWADMIKAAQSGGRRAELVRQGYGDLAALLWALDEELDEGDLGHEEILNSEEKPAEEPVEASEEVPVEEPAPVEEEPVEEPTPVEEQGHTCSECGSKLDPAGKEG